jgi:chromosome segregation ATPase
LEEELKMDEDDSDSLYQEEIRSLQRESDYQRLSGRMNLLFVLIPAIICAVFAFAYIDLRGKLKETESTGAKEVQALSQDVVERVTSVLEQTKALEESIEARIAAIEKGIQETNGVLKKTQKDLDNLDTSKMDKAATKTMVEEMNLQVSDVKKALAAQTATLEGLSVKLEKELDESANAVTTFQSDMRMQTEKVTNLLQTIEKMQKRDLELDLGIRRLFDDREAWNKEIEEEKQATIVLQEKIDALEGEIAWLLNRLKIKREKKVSPEKEKTGANAVKPSDTSGMPAGGFVEQDISR